MWWLPKKSTREIPTSIPYRYRMLQRKSRGRTYEVVSELAKKITEALAGSHRRASTCPSATEELLRSGLGDGHQHSSLTVIVVYGGLSLGQQRRVGIFKGKRVFRFRLGRRGESCMYEAMIRTIC